MELKYIKNPDEENIIKNINTLTIDECNKYLTDKNKLFCLDLGNFRPIPMIDEKIMFMNIQHVEDDLKHIQRDVMR